MGTRERLNGAFFQGSILLAALLGGLAESWLAFVLALIVLLGLNIYAGEIRFPPQQHRPDRKQPPRQPPRR